jgi:hypothetical protein
MPAGNIADLAYALQSAQGTPASTPEIRSYLTGGYVMPNRTINDIEETTGQRIRNRAVIASVEVGGTPEIAARADDLGLWLLGALGYETAGASGSDYSHVITNAGSLPWMTFWTMLGSLIYAEYDDCKIAQLVLTSEAGQPLKAQATVMGLTPKSHDSSAYATWAAAKGITDENPLMHYDASPFLVYGGTAVTTGVTGDETTNVLTKTSHGLVDGDTIQFLTLTGGAGLAVKTTYYVRDKTTSTFKLAATSGGTAIDFTTAITDASYTPGSNVGCIDKVVLTINNNAVIQRGDSISGCSITEGLLDITLELTTLITDASLYNRFHYGAASPSNGAAASHDVYELSGGVDLFWVRSAHRTLEIFCPRLQLASLGGYEPNTSGEPLKDTQTYKVYQPVSGNGITATVLNGHAAY